MDNAHYATSGIPLFDVDPSVAKRFRAELTLSAIAMPESHPGRMDWGAARFGDWLGAIGWANEHSGTPGIGPRGGPLTRGFIFPVQITNPPMSNPDPNERRHWMRPVKDISSLDADLIEHTEGTPVYTGQKRIPKYTQALAMRGSGHHASSRKPLIYPFAPLTAQHRGADAPEYSTLVHDVFNDGGVSAISGTQRAELSTVFRVIDIDANFQYMGGGQTSSNHAAGFRKVVALNFGPAGPHDAIRSSRDPWHGSAFGAATFSSTGQSKFAALLSIEALGPLGYSSDPKHIISPSTPSGVPVVSGALGTHGLWNFNNKPHPLFGLRNGPMVSWKPEMQYNAKNFADFEAPVEIVWDKDYTYTWHGKVMKGAHRIQAWVDTAEYTEPSPITGSRGGDQRGGANDRGLPAGISQQQLDAALVGNRHIGHQQPPSGSGSPPGGSGPGGRGNGSRDREESGGADGRTSRGGDGTRPGGESQSDARRSINRHIARKKKQDPNWESPAERRARRRAEREERRRNRHRNPDGSTDVSEAEVDISNVRSHATGRSGTALYRGVHGAARARARAEAGNQGSVGVLHRAQSIDRESGGGIRSDGGVAAIDGTSGSGVDSGIAQDHKDGIGEGADPSTATANEVESPSRYGHAKPALPEDGFFPSNPGDADGAKQAGSGPVETEAGNGSVQSAPDSDQSIGGVHASNGRDSRWINKHRFTEKQWNEVPLSSHEIDVPVYDLSRRIPGSSNPNERWPVVSHRRGVLRADGRVAGIGDGSVVLAPANIKGKHVFLENKSKIPETVARFNRIILAIGSGGEPRVDGRIGLGARTLESVDIASGAELRLAYDGPGGDDTPDLHIWTKDEDAADDAQGRLFFNGEQVTPGGGGGGGSGELIEKQFTQASHGLAAGSPVARNTSGAWVAATRSDGDLVAAGIVSEVIDANTLKITSRGYVELGTGEWDAVTGGSGGLLPGRYYWLDTEAGMLTTTKPTAGIAQVALQGITSTIALVIAGEALEVGDGVVAVRTIADDDDITANDRYVFVDTTGGAVTATLPAAVAGMVFTVKLIVTDDSATVAVSSGDSINGVVDDTVVITVAEAVTFVARANGAWETV